MTHSNAPPEGGGGPADAGSSDGCKWDTAHIPRGAPLRVPANPYRVWADIWDAIAPLGPRLPDHLHQALDSAFLVTVTGEEDRERTHAAGFDVHLLKPVELKDLKVLLRKRPYPAPRPKTLKAAAS